MLDFSMATIFWLVLVAALLVTAKYGVKQVPQSKIMLIERMGKYHHTLHSGIGLIIPFIDKPKVIDATLPGDLKYHVDISEQQLPIPGQGAITTDNVRIKLDIQAFYKITDAAKFIYRIRDGKGGVRATIDATVRALVGRRTFEEFNADRLRLASEIAEEVRNTAEEWGVSMGRVEITEVSAEDSKFAESMHDQAQAERVRRANVLSAQGNAEQIRIEAEAQAFAIRQAADAELYRAQKEAEAIRIKAEAETWAFSTKGASLANEGAQMAQHAAILMAQVEAFERIGGADNAKLVVVPADLVQATSMLSRFFKKD